MLVTVQGVLNIHDISDVVPLSFSYGLNYIDFALTFLYGISRNYLDQTVFHAYHMGLILKGFWVRC
jgi:hypothetical protein